MKKVYLIAVVFALIAGLATFMFARQINEKTTIKDAETVNVVVALQDIPKNTMLADDMFAEDAGYFQVRKIVKDYATPDYVEKLDDIRGKVTAVDVYQGEQMNIHKVVDTDSDEVGLSFKLENGKKAYSFTASTTNGVDGYISAGDTVDIITYETDDQGNVTTKVAYKNLNVIRVSNNTDNTNAQASDSKITNYSTITVEVTEKQALKLYEIENSKTFKLVLNSKRDEEQTETQGDDQQAAQAEQPQAEQPQAEQNA